jgi:hypothetical protein
MRFCHPEYLRRAERLITIGFNQSAALFGECDQIVAPVENGIAAVTRRAGLVKEGAAV